MKHIRNLKTFDELGEEAIVSSRTSRLYPVSRYLPSDSIKNNLLYLSLYGKINAVFPYYYDMRESDSYLMIYTVSGSGKLTVKNASVLLTENTVLFFCCAQAHTIGLHDAKEWQYEVLNLNGNAVAFYYEAFMRASASTKNVSDADADALLDSNLFIITPSSKIPSVFKRLEALVENADGNLYFGDLDLYAPNNSVSSSCNAALMVSLLLTELLTELIVEKNAFYTRCAEIPSYLYVLKKDLDESYMEPWRLDMMEERYKVSKFSIVHDFTEHFGISPISYLIRRRIDAARELLGETELAVNRVAAAVGIDNINHFIYLFKKEVGMTPSAWRKNVRMHGN